MNCYKCGKAGKLALLDHCRGCFPSYLKMVDVLSVKLVSFNDQPFEARLQTLAIKGLASAWRHDASDAKQYLLSIVSIIGKKFGGITIEADE